MSDQQKFIELCEQNDTVPLFSQPWWLDAICGRENWDVVVHEKGGRVVGAWPFVIRSKFGFKAITCPKLTQTLGIWLAGSEAKYAKRLGQEKDIVQSLVKKLPKHSALIQSFHHSFENWLPLFWSGFEAVTKYTYVIPDLQDLDAVWSETNANIRTDIRKAEKRLQVREDLSIEEFYRVVSLTYERQNMKITYSLPLLTRVINAAKERGCGTTLFAVDEQERVHAVLFLVWDKLSAYYLIGGADPELRKSGAGSLNVWKAIQLASEKTRSFDFEGSMVEGIERFFRGFGARQQPYFRIMKFNSSFVACAHYLRRRWSGKI
ncbi:MAG: GNAT family N-acetyltransferase [Planctomycetota bacterium]